MRTTAVSFAPAQTPGLTRGRQWVFGAPSTTEVRCGGPFPRGLEQGQGWALVPSGRVSPSGPVRAGPQRCRVPEAPLRALRHGLGGVRGKLWAGDKRGGVGWRRWTPSTPVRGRLASRAAPAGRNHSRAGSGTMDWGAPRARREGRGLPGGARVRGGGARAHAPCTRAILE